jgi:hypothetical protein
VGHVPQDFFLLPPLLQSPTEPAQTIGEALMSVTTPGGRFRTGMAVLAISLLASMAPERLQAASEGEDGTLEKLIVASGRIALELDRQRLGDAGSASARKGSSTLRFDAERDSFLTVLVFNGELRAALPGSMRLVPLDSTALPARLEASRRQLVVEQAPWGGQYEMAIRDGVTGFLFFNVEGHEAAYDPARRALTVRSGRVLISEELAAEMGRPSEAGAVVGTISIDATMRPIEVSEIVDGEIRAEVLPGVDADQGGVPGPDVIVGELIGLAQFGASSGTQVGLAVGTDSCNAGVVNLNWFALPSNDHPVIPQNLYRMSGGATNDERFEHIGQSNVKHAFTALQQNVCNFGCSASGTGTLLGAGCSDPYSAGLNSGPNLGSRAWINPFTGFYPRGDSATPPNVHGAAHTHLGPSHRILTEIADLNTSLNQGATYYAEAQYVTPHEYAWCQTHPGECNMNNNASYRRYNVSGTASPFTFVAAGPTVRMQPAIAAWTGATVVEARPVPASDGAAFIGYKVTNPSPGVWHYEYAIYNQNLDRAIQSFAIPKRVGVTLSNVGFHAPPQHPGWAADGTVGNTGYSSLPWAQVESGGQVSWSSETIAQNTNANAVRWGTLYNIRFDSNRPPVSSVATIGFFKTGAPMAVVVQAPASADVTCSRNGPC